MKKINIRKASRNDLQSILDLVHGLAIFEKEPQAVTTTIDDYLEAFDEGLIDAHVATTDDQVIGMALYYMTFSTWKGKMFYLEDFYVDEAYRSEGVGQLLFDAYLAEAKKRKCTMAKWQVLDWNEKAIKFYKRNNAVIEQEWYNGKIIF